MTKPWPSKQKIKNPKGKGNSFQWMYNLASTGVFRRGLNLGEWGGRGVGEDN